MKLDVSVGRWGPGKIKPTVVKLAPGWWRIEWLSLAVEVDNEPSAGWGRLVAPAAALLLALLVASEARAGTSQKPVRTYAVETYFGGLR